ncbi:transcriptional regulator, LacI family [Streptomyces sp. DvalAA-14]|uniref:LacI family DNA-binding transcriptional regulator n=1 Tax=unclassified Streptomyces TaxID=2593676 RepID=UPI00081B5CCE|nr:LacI family DNA-binding transcriptional regulator [Streptomyces sp. DvalAA-14]SCD68969.1 transcriptional regulator, LacI family [Streptomyces sp. DvalAA-14]
MTGSARPTSRDVARAAGVSQATVSLVLGGKWRGRVSERTADTVRAAAGELGYRPNLAARNLRLGRTRTALLVVPALTHEYFARVYSGAERVAAEHGFGLVLYPSPEGIGRARDPFGSARAAIDGVIASSMAADALAGIADGGDAGRGRGAGGAAERDPDGGLPLVMLDSDPGARGGAPTVNLAVFDGIRQVTRHLLTLGHRRFTHLASAVDAWTFRVRAQAVAAELSRVPGAVLLHTERSALDVAPGRAAALRALSRPGPRPTALICDSDVLAAGACKAARGLGLDVPGDLSISGFDDLALATAIDPELTTVRLPAEAVGAAGMRALLALLARRDGGAPGAGLPGLPGPDGPSAPSPLDLPPDFPLDFPVELPVELVVRASTGPPPR